MISERSVGEEVYELATSISKYCQKSSIHKSETKKKRKKKGVYDSRYF